MPAAPEVRHRSVPLALRATLQCDPVAIVVVVYGSLDGETLPTGNPVMFKCFY